MNMDIVFAAQASKFSDSKQLLLIKNVAHEHLLTRVEELGAIFAKWSVGRVRLFVQQELEQFVRQQRFPVNDEEVQWIAQALIKELSGLGPLDDLMADPEVEDILINGYERVFVSRKG
ncbi:MAG: CpaF family protein, partial [Comamonas sp.]